MEINIKKNVLSKEDKEFFKKMNPGFSVTGDTIKICFEDGSETEYAVLKGLYTKMYSCRECLEYYEVALADGVVRISKDTLEIM